MATSVPDAKTIVRGQTLDREFKQHFASAHHAAGAASLLFAKPALYEIGTYDGSYDTLCLAAVCPRLRPEDFKHETLDIRQHQYLLWRLPADQQDTLFATILEECRNAANEGARIICTSELAFPTYPERCEEGTKGDGVRKWTMDDVHMEERSSEMQELVDEHACFVLAGSFHCFDTWCNRCLFFFPQKLSKTPSPIVLDKNTTGIRADEVVRRASPPEFAKILTPFGTITPLICTDILSPEIFLAILQETYQQRKHLVSPHIVLNPALVLGFRAGRIMRAAERLAEAAGIMTVFVNYNETGDHEIPAAFVYGNHGHKDSGKELSQYTRLFDINLETQREWAEKRRAELSVRLRYIWGMDAPTIFESVRIPKSISRKRPGRSTETGTASGSRRDGSQRCDN